MTERSQNAVKIFDELASQYEAKYMDTSIYHDTFDAFCNAITRTDASILDLACGPGNITRYLLHKRPGYKILGIDLAEGMLRIAKVHNPAAKFQKMDCRKLNDLTEAYDGIMCGFVFPYLSKEELLRLIADMHTRLVDNGIVYFSTMEGAYETSGMHTSSSGHQMFIHYHEEGYLKKFFSDSGFKILTTDWKRYMRQDGKDVTDLIMIVQKST